MSCDQEDNTGLSTIVPTNPSLSITTSVSSLSLIEDDSSYGFTVTISETQLVDIKLSVSQIGGDATMGEDFSVSGSLIIPAGSTSASGSITILSDELMEETETVKIQIGDNTTANGLLSYLP